MKAFFSETQFLHDPQQFMRIGRIARPTDLPSRAQALMGTLRKLDIALQSPADTGRAPLERVHEPAYLDYLATAYQRWQTLGSPGVEPGIEVLPNLSPYYSARPGEPRGPCPNESLIAQTGYYIGDLSCPLGPDSWRSILSSAHTAAAAAQAVCEGEPSAYALCRPSGHHAHRDRAGGFCYVNNSAIAAALLQARFARVAVLDVDAHHGDGTQNIFYDRADVMTLSTHADTTAYYPFYTGYAHERGHGEGLGYNLNLPLPHGSGSVEFLQAVAAGCAEVRQYAPGALVVPLGFDTYKSDPISVLRVDMDAYRAVGEHIGALNLPTVIVQEGGYMVEAIGQALAHFLQGFQAGRSQ